MFINTINVPIVIPIAILLLVLLLITTGITLTIKKIKVKSIIYNELSIIGPTKVIKNKPFDYEIETKECNYLIKVIFNFRKLEISVNSKNYWQLNDKVVSSKKGGTKLEGIYDLINADLKSSKPLKKIYLVYPDAKVLVKAINESELSFIYPNTDCYGAHLVKFDEIKEITKI